VNNSLKIYIVIISLLILSVPFNVRSQTWQEYLEKAEFQYEGLCADSAVYYGELALEEGIKQYGPEDTVVAKIMTEIAVYARESYDLPKYDSMSNKAIRIWKSKVSNIFDLRNAIYDTCRYMAKIVIMDDTIYKKIIGQFEEEIYNCNELHYLWYSFIEEYYNLDNIINIIRYQIDYNNIESDTVIENYKEEWIGLIKGLIHSSRVPNLADAQYFLGMASSILKTGNIYSADTTIICAWNIAKYLLDSNDIRIAKYHLMKGIIGFYKRTFTESFDIIAAKNIYLSHYGNISPEVAKCNLWLARSYYYDGNYINSINAYDSVIDCLFYSNSYDLLQEILSAEDIYWMMDYDTKSFKLAKHAERLILLHDKYLSRVSLKLYKWLINKYIYYDSSELAVEYFNKALNVSDELYGLNSNYSLEIKWDIGKYYFDRNNYPIARSYWEGVIGHYNNNGNNVNGLWKRYDDLAILYMLDDNTVKAESLLSISGNLILKRFGGNHGYMGEHLEYLYNYYLQTGFYDSCYDIAHRIDSIYTVVNDPSFVEHKMRLLENYLRIGDTINAIDVLNYLYNNIQIDRNIDRNTIVPYSDGARPLKGYKDIHELYYTYSERLLNNGYACYAEKLAKMAYDDYYAKFVDIYNVIGRREDDIKMDLWKLRKMTDKYISINIMNNKCEESLKNRLNVVYNSKNAISELFLRRNIWSYYIREIMDSILLLDEREREYYHKFSDDNSLLSSCLDSLDKIRDKLDDSLSALFDWSQDAVVFDSLATKDRIMLPESTLYVDFYKFRDRYELEDEYWDEYYLITAMTNDSIYSYIIESDSVDTLIDEYVSHYYEIVRSGNMVLDIGECKKYNAIAKRLYSLLLKNIDLDINLYKYIFISPDDKINLISFAGLVDENDKYMIERYSIHYLTSIKDVIRLELEMEPGEGLLALGNPDFWANHEERESSTLDNVLDNKSLANVDNIRNIRSNCNSFREDTVSALPASENEIINAISNWSQFRDKDTTTLLGAYASEDNFKRCAPGKEVIHLATHGYFIRDECKKISNNSDVFMENPLLQSGLLLAGCNLHGEGADENNLEDGILSSMEVAEMDLRGTELVFLSACESGRGKIRSGEGVQGLRWAFQLAGARTVISTLWPIPDEMTAIMLRSLYKNKNQTIPDQLRQVQLQQIKWLRDNGLSDHPISWGAFISIGDWE